MPTGRGSILPKRGVSPVIGTVLMIVITVLLVALIASLATGFGSELEEPVSNAAFETEWSLDGEDNGDKAYFEITHRTGDSLSGDDLYIKDGEGNKVKWDTVWTGGDEVSASEFAHIDGYGSDSNLVKVCEQEAGYAYRLVRQTESGSEVLRTFELPRDPASCP